MHDYAGFTLASGDVDGNGSSDLLISAAHDSDAASYAGQTYLILAPAAPPPFQRCPAGGLAS